MRKEMRFLTARYRSCAMSAQRSAQSRPRRPQRSMPSVRTTTLVQACWTMARSPRRSKVKPPAIAGNRASASRSGRSLANATSTIPGTTIIRTARTRPARVAGCVAAISPLGTCSPSTARPSPSARFAGAFGRRCEEVLLRRDQPQLLRHWSKASPMQRTSAKALQCVEVVRRRISLVITKAIARILGVEGSHQAVAVHLGDDAGGADGDALGVALDDRLLRHGEPVEPARVDEQVLRLRVESENGALQRHQAGAIDVEAVDLLHLRPADAHRDRLRADLRLQGIALFRSELFGIIDSLDSRSGVKDDRRGDHRPGERRHAHFVAAADQEDALVPERLLERAEARQPAAFRLG